MKGCKRESAGLLFVGMLLLWVVVYPVAFFRRSAFSTPNLGIVALLVALFFVAGPSITSLLMPFRLPSCTSKEVVQLLEKVIRSTPVGAAVKTIDGHRELRYDGDTNVRHGECVAHMESGDVPVKFIVEWQDRSKGLFQVRLPEPELPSCTSKEVVKLLEQVIRSTPVGAAAKTIDGHRELSYDGEAKVRHGECVAHRESGDVPVKFIVEWKDWNKGLFQVRLLEPELPACTSKEVVQLIEQVIRSTPVGAAVKTIDGHRELSYDGEANVRHGECTAHRESGDMPVGFIVEWQDRDKGLFQVRVFDSSE